MNAMWNRMVALGTLLVAAALPLTSFGQDFSLKVQPERQRGKILDQHRLLAERLTAMEIQPSTARIERYLAVNQPNFPAIIGWRGMLTEIETTPGGFVATVRVSARFDRVIDSFYVLERYFVTKQDVRLLGVDGPPSGKSRFLFGL